MEGVISHLEAAKSSVKEGQSALGSGQTTSQRTDPSLGPNSDLPHYTTPANPSIELKQGPNADLPHYDPVINPADGLTNPGVLTNPDGFQSNLPNIPLPLPALDQLDPGQYVEVELRSGENGPFKSVTVSHGVSGLAGVGLENPILNQGGESEITMTFEIGATAGYNASLDGKVLGGGVDVYAGANVSYSVTVPESAYDGIRDGSLPHPDLSDPTTWPVGAQVLLTGEMVQGSTYEASYRAFMLENGIEESEGVVVGMTRAEDGTMRAYAGDTSSVSQYLTAGIGTENFNIGLGNDTELRDSSLQFRDIDINHPNADSPFGLIESMTAGGVSDDSVLNSGQIELLTYTSATSVNLQLGPVGGSYEIGENGGRSMVITNADGSQDVEFFASYASGQSILQHSTVDPSGHVTVQDGIYYDTIPQNSEVYAHLEIATGAGFESSDASQDATLSIKITPEFMAELNTRYADAFTRDDLIVHAADHFSNFDDSSQLDLGTPQEFMANMGRGSDSSNHLASLMSSIVTHDQIYLGESIPFEHLEFEFIEG